MTIIKSNNILRALVIALLITLVKMFDIMTKFNVLPLKVNLSLGADWIVGLVLGLIPASNICVIYTYLFIGVLFINTFFFFEIICILISRSIQ